MKKLILVRLKIHNFRSLKNLDLVFYDKYNEITGCNGTGKSSILDCIRFMLTDRDEFNNKLTNYKTITDSNEEDFPSVELTINYASKNFLLKTEKNTWFINGIEQKNRTSYLNTIEDFLNVNSEKLVFTINPNILKDILSGVKESNDKQKIRTAIVGIVNSLSDVDNQVISQEEYENLNNEILELKEEVKNFKNNEKNLQNEIENFKKFHSEIKNWEDIDEVSDLDKEENRLNEIKKNFSSIKDEIEKKYNSLDVLKNKLLKLQNDKTDYENFNNQELNENKPSIWEILIFILLSLTIIFGIIYYFLYWKPKYSKNEFKENNLTSSRLKDNRDEIKNTEKQIAYLKESINQLEENSNYKNVNYDLIVDKLSEIKSQKESNDSFKNAKIQLENFFNNLKKLQKEKQQKEFELQTKESEKRKITELTNSVIKKYFPNFDIDFFNETNKESLNIRKENVPLNYLNHSTKMNTIFEINNFLNKELGFDSFVLIDGGESFNKVYNSNNQTIVAKVTNENKLKLNGKDLY